MLLTTLDIFVLLKGSVQIVKEELLKQAPEILRGFLGYMQTIRGKSPKTVEEYFIDLRTFFRYMKKVRGLVSKDCEMEDISIDDVDITLIEGIQLVDVFEYMNYLISERKNNARTRSRKASSLRAFFNYLTTKTGDLKENPLKELETPKAKESLPKFLTLEQSKMLLKAVDSYNSVYKERDYCILTLLLNCGLRLSELVGINLSDIREDNTLKVTGKGNKERMIYLNNACRKAIDRYKNVRSVDKTKDKDAFFISRNNRRISPKTVQHLVNMYLRVIGLGGQGYSVHKLRHTAATLMYQYGNVDVRILKDILGHENLGTTEIYTHLSNSQVKKAFDLNPLCDE